MLELEIQSPTRMRLRVGRWHLRTWRSRVMKLPRRYRRPEVIYAVETIDGNDQSQGQIGAFFSAQAADGGLSQLESEGRAGLVINLIAVHTRLDDWQFDR